MDTSKELQMSVSPICQKNGKKVAYVAFSDEVRTAEGEIPECRITRNSGFSDEEVRQLEQYMKAELATLKKMAAGINVMQAFMEK